MYSMCGNGRQLQHSMTLAAAAVVYAAFTDHYFEPFRILKHRFKQTYYNSHCQVWELLTKIQAVWNTSVFILVRPCSKSALWEKHGG